MGWDSGVAANSEQPRGWACYIWGVLYPAVYLSSVPRDRQHPLLQFHCIQCLLLFGLLE